MFQNVSIIFFSAAKETNESKIKEEDENEPINDEIDSETDSAISDNDNEHEESDYDEDEKDALICAEEDIELFKRQLGDLDNAVCNTAVKIDRIQEVLDKVLESLRIGKPIEDYPRQESTENKEFSPEIEKNQVHSSPEIVKNENQEQNSQDTIENQAKVQNSHEIFNRDKLLDVLKRTHVDRLKNPPRVTVGMIGYPNVGKSSTVNVLMQVKKVSVQILRYNSDKRQNIGY